MAEIRFDQVGGRAGGGDNLRWDIIGRAFAAADAVGGPVPFDAVGQRGGGGMRGGGFRGGGFRGGFRGGRGARVVRNFQGPRFRVFDVWPQFPWWGASWWPYAYPYAANVYTPYPQQFRNACEAAARAEVEGRPQATIDTLRAQCVALVFTDQPAAVATPVAAPAYGYGYRGAWPWGTPGYLAY